MIIGPAAQPPSFPAWWYWSCDLQTVSFASGHSIRWHWRDTAVGKGPPSPGSRAFPSCSSWATVSTCLCGRHPEAAFPSALAHQPTLPTVSLLPCLPPDWHLSMLHPVSHTSPSMRPEPQPCRQGKGSSKSVPSLGPLPQSTSNGCSLQLLVLHSLEMYWPLFVVDQPHY